MRALRLSYFHDIDKHWRVFIKRDDRIKRLNVTGFSNIVAPRETAAPSRLKTRSMRFKYLPWRGRCWGTSQTRVGIPHRSDHWADLCKFGRTWCWTDPCRPRWRWSRSWHGFRCSDAPGSCVGSLGRTSARRTYLMRDQSFASFPRLILIGWSWYS